VSRRLRAFGRLVGGRSGQTFVDFALMMPIITLLVMGAFDFSVAVGRAAQLTSAVQEGASQARQDPTNSTNIKDRVKKEASALNLADADIVITCYSGTTTTTKTCSTATFGDTVKVQATYNYSPITGRLASISGSPLAIVQSATSEIY
jgi:Flp pilus assembly protein TadG